MINQLLAIALWKKITVVGILLSAVVTFVVWPEEVRKQPEKKIKYDIKFLNVSKKVTKRKLKKLSLQDKIGQMVMLDVDVKTADTTNLKVILKTCKPGGILFRNGTPDDQLWLANYCQKFSEIPLILAREQNEYENVHPLPRGVQLASIGEDSLIQMYIAERADELKYTGMNMLFTEHLGLDRTPDTINGYNKFQDKDSAISKMISYSHHFDKKVLLAGIPGFGCIDLIDTGSAKYDSAFAKDMRVISKGGIPVIRITGEEMLNCKTQGKMALRKTLDFSGGFKGLVVGDFRDSALSPVAGVKMGTDMVISSDSAIEVVLAIHDMIKQKKITEADVDHSVLKILQAKKWLGLEEYEPLKSDTLEYVFRGKYRKLLNQMLTEHSISVIRNDKNILPINRVWNQSLLIVSIGKPGYWPMISRLRSYHPAWNKTLAIQRNGTLPALSVSNLKWYNPLVLVLNDVEIDTARDKKFLSSLKELTKQTNVIISNFGNTKSLKHLAYNKTIVHTWNNDPQSMDLTAQIIFGGTVTTGHIPIAIGDSISAKSGFIYRKPVRLKYTMAEEVGINSDSLRKIDAIVRSAIRFRATPGCQIFVAHKGKVIYNKAFGYHTYKRRTKVHRDDMYDIASVTKVFATTLAVMKLYDEKRIKLSHNLRKYFKKEMDTLRHCKVKNVVIENLLLHKSGLPSYMPIVNYLQNSDSLYGRWRRYFCDKKEGWFTVELGEDFYLRKDILDTIWMDMKMTRVRNDTKYIYSDLNFNLLQKLVERRTDKDLDDYCRKSFYVPLGLQRTLFNPLDKFKEKYIVPTEKDKWWRKQLVRGYCHDPSAALLGGVGGNAGLFSTAHDLGVLGQMLLNGGTYGGKRFFQSKTVKKFVTKHRDSHRGLGFNKPVKNKKRFIAPSSSMKSYGHTGFSGTCVWIDPEHEIVYVFLSNRLHPKAKNWKLNNFRVRSRVHQVIYDCLGVELDKEELKQQEETKDSIPETDTKQTKPAKPTT